MLGYHLVLVTLHHDLQLELVILNSIFSVIPPRIWAQYAGMHITNVHLQVTSLPLLK